MDDIYYRIVFAEKHNVQVCNSLLEVFEFLAQRTFFESFIIEKVYQSKVIYAWEINPYEDKNEHNNDSTVEFWI